jgi:CBS domain-containing protein
MIDLAGCRYRAVTYASPMTTASAAENSAGTGKMKRHAMTPIPTVVSAMTAIIGRRRAGSVLASDASCYKRIVSISMSTLMDHPNPMKKSRYDRFAPIVSKRTSVIDFSTGFSPIGDQWLSPPIAWPAVKISEIAEAMRSSSVVVTPPDSNGSPTGAIVRMGTGRTSA